jgi:hypothetical protein
MLVSSIIPMEFFAMIYATISINSPVIRRATPSMLEWVAAPSFVGFYAPDRLAFA